MAQIAALGGRVRALRRRGHITQAQLAMQLGISPELTQAAYRVGDSTANIITPLLPYFPLIVVYCQRHSKTTGVGTLISAMLPYSITFLVLWTAFLLLYWMLGIPLGLQAPYTYP